MGAPDISLCWRKSPLVATCICAAEPWRPLPGVAVRDDGRIVVGGIELGLQHHDGSWRASMVDKAVRTPGARVGDAWRQAGAWTTAFSLSAGLAYLVYAGLVPGGAWQVGWGVRAVEYGLPVLVALVESRRRPWGRP